MAKVPTVTGEAAIKAFARAGFLFITSRGAITCKSGQATGIIYRSRFIVAKRSA